MGDITTLTTIDALMKVRQMNKEVKDQFNKRSPLLTEMKQKLGTEVGGGRSVEIPLRFSANTAYAGVRGDAGDMARGSAGSYDKFIVPIYPVNATGKIGAIAELKSKKDIQSLKSVLDAAIDDIKDGFPMTQGKLLWGAGDGRVARINGTPDLDTMIITIDAEFTSAGGFTPGALHLDKGMWLQASSSLTDVNKIRAGVAQVVSFTATTVTVTGNISSWADNDYLTAPDVLANCPNGILGINNTSGWGSGTYLNLSQTTYSELVPQIQASITTGNIENYLVLNLLKAMNDTGEYPGMGLCPYRVYAEMFLDAKSDRRFTNISNANRKYGLGLDAVTVTAPGGSAVEFFIDRYQPGGAASSTTAFIAILKPEDWKWVRAEGKGPDWYKDPSGSMTHAIPGTYGRLLNYLDVYNVICECPRRQVFLQDIQLDFTKAS